MLTDLLGFLGIGIGIILAAAFILTIVVSKMKASKRIYGISNEETQKFLHDSIAIQPNNDTVFKNQTLDEVIESGFSIMKREKYRVLEGVDKDGI